MPHWYLLYYKARHYKSISQHLSRLNIPFYMPVRAVLVPRADRLTSHRRYEVPLFPGYVFIRLDIEVTHPSVILKIPSVVDFVRTGGCITKIPDAVITGLQIAPMVIDEINFLNSPSVIYCENCPYDVLIDVIERFNHLSDKKSDDERVVWLLNMVNEIINAPANHSSLNNSPEKIRTQKREKWLGKIMKLKMEDSFT
ncbi:hypothetical protein LOV73_004669 [Salmonella enterica]|nr:hypothetical protein [Salmonella enterica]